MRGTLLNTATVAAGASLGLLVGKVIPTSYQEVAMHGMGLVTCGIAVRMFLKSGNPLIAAVSVSIGGVIGAALGLHDGITALAEWAKGAMGQGGSSHFVNGMVTSFVLFCIGPMTLLSCLQDALEKKLELMSLKSTMDGISAIFLAAASGAGVLVTALLVLVFQGSLTLLAHPLKPLAKDEEALQEVSATGGAILLATGLGLMEVKDFHTANYLPAIFLAPALVFAMRKAVKITRGV